MTSLPIILGLPGATDVWPAWSLNDPLFAVDQGRVPPDLDGADRVTIMVHPAGGRPLRLVCNVTCVMESLDHPGSTRCLLVADRLTGDDGDIDVGGSTALRGLTLGVAASAVCEVFFNEEA